MVAYRFLLNRLYQLPLSQEQQQHEMKTIHQIAKKNGYPINVIEKLNNQIKNNVSNKTPNNLQTKQIKKWAIFEYHNPIIRKLTNMFKNTELQIAHQVKNTTQNILKEHDKKLDICENSGIYSLRCNTCNKQYVGQTGRNLKTRHLEHYRYIKFNDPKIGICNAHP
jgi:hypothetical protein